MRTLTEKEKDSGHCEKCDMAISWNGAEHFCPRCFTKEHNRLVNQPLASDMTLRDYFAGQALIGLVNGGYDSWSDLSDDCLGIADAMIEARKGKL